MESEQDELEVTEAAQKNNEKHAKHNNQIKDRKKRLNHINEMQSIAQQKMKKLRSSKFSCIATEFFEEKDDESQGKFTAEHISNENSYDEGRFAVRGTRRSVPIAADE